MHNCQLQLGRCVMLNTGTPAVAAVSCTIRLEAAPVCLGDHKSSFQSLAGKRTSQRSLCKRRRGARHAQTPLKTWERKRAQRSAACAGVSKARGMPKPP